MHGGAGMTDGWGNGFYAESRDGICFELAEPATAYRRQLRYADGSLRTQCNLERPGLLFDGQGRPTHLFCATGHGRQPYDFEGGTYIVCIPLAK